MSDRSKKILWIAVAVSGFTLIVFLTAFLLFPPSGASASKPFDLTGRAPGKVQPANDFSAFPSIVVQSSGGDAQTQGSDQTGSSSPASDGSIVVLPAPSAPTSAQSQSAAPAAAATPAAPAPKPAAPKPAAAPTSPKPAAAKPTAATAAAKPAAVPAPSSAQPSAGAPATASASSAEYWIQVGSFSEKATADKLRGEFESRGMTSIIATKAIGGRNYYQVKVGPYANTAEAKKWIGTVKAVPGSSQDAFITTR